MKNKFLMILAAGLLSGSMTASATLITYDFDSGDNGLTSVVKTVGGLTLTVTDFSLNTITNTDFDGLCVAGNTQPGSFCNNLTSLTLSLSAAARLISYEVGFLSPGMSGVTLLFSQGPSSSSETGFIDEATSNFANQFIALGGQAINVSASNLPVGRFGSLQFRQITFDDSVAVPAPATLAMFGLGLAGLGFSLRRKV